MREIANLPEGRASQEPLDLIRERARLQRLIAVLGFIGLGAILLPFLLREMKAYRELGYYKKFEGEPSGGAISRLSFRLRRSWALRFELRLMAISLLLSAFSEIGRNYLYKLLVQACAGIDKRHPSFKAVRGLFTIFGEYRLSVEDLDLQGVDLGGKYLHQANLAGVNLSQANLASAYLRRADLSQSKLEGAILTNTEFRGAALVKVNARQAVAKGASFVNADLSNANWESANLENAILDGAIIENANLRSVNLRGGSLVGVRFVGCDLRQADFAEANLRHADLVECAVSNCNFQGAYVYGTAAWGLKGIPANSSNLVITPEGEPEVSVDDLEVAQLLYLLLYDANVRRVIDAVTSSIVLILGRFTDEGMEVLELLRSELRNCGYSPVLFNFERPANRDLTETISTLAHLARFVIADITDARSIPQELARIIPGLPSVPVKPILKAGSVEYGMFEHLKRYPWVLPISEYVNSAELAHSLNRTIIQPVELFLTGQE